MQTESIVMQDTAPDLPNPAFSPLYKPSIEGYLTDGENNARIRRLDCAQHLLFMNSRVFELE